MAQRITRQTDKSIPLGGLDEGSAGRASQVDRQPDRFGASSSPSHEISILQHETVHNVGSAAGEGVLRTQRRCVCNEYSEIVEPSLDIVLEAWPGWQR